MSWIGVITNVGAAMLSEWTQGGHTLTIDKATVGSGIRSAVNLRTATALAQEKANASIVSSKQESTGTQFRIRVGPAAVTAYTAHEIGIWGHLDNDSTLTLIAIHQDADTGIEVPTEASMPSFQFDLYCLHAIGNEGTLNITLTEEVYPTIDEMEAAISVVADELEDAQDAIVDILGDFATVETTGAASRAYKVGEYLTYNGHLYRVTTAISSGGAITPGTNVVQTTVGAEIANRVLWWQSKSIASTGGSSGTLLTITDPAITADHVMDKCVLANPSVLTSDITCTTSAGQAVLTGTTTAATTAEIKLVKKDN